MRALTLTQPWAGLVASGIKLIENRPRRMIKRECFGIPFAIHASRDHDQSVWRSLIDVEPRLALDHTESLTRRDRLYELMTTTSCVVGIATVDSVLDPLAHGIMPHEPDAAAPLEPDQRRWFSGPVGYVLRDVQALARPVPCKGKPGFWRLDADVERLVRRQIAEAT